MNLPTTADKKIFVDALKRFDITEAELNDAFWLAYSDPYVPQSGVEFRHLWKHIEVMRKGEDRKTYTYEQMLDVMNKRKIPMSSFSMIDEIDSQGRRKWVLK
jgi:hypothetical protein